MTDNKGEKTKGRIKFMRWYHWFLAPFGKWFKSCYNKYWMVGFTLADGRMFILMEGWDK